MFSSAVIGNRFLLQTYTGHNESYTQGFFQLLGGGGGGGASTSLPPPPPPQEILLLDLLLDTLWWNLGLFSNKHNLPFMCHYN